MWFAKQNVWYNGKNLLYSIIDFKYIFQGYIYNWPVKRTTSSISTIFLHLIYFSVEVEKIPFSTVSGNFQKVVDQKSIKLCLWKNMKQNLFPNITSPITTWCRGHLKHALRVYDIVRCYDEKTVFLLAGVSAVVPL